MRAPFRYFGSKFRLASWILQFFPPHETYVEPYAGALGVLLNKPPAWIEVVNDINGDIVNFYRHLRTNPQALIESIDLTPYARQEFRSADDVIRLQENDYSLERARCFYIQMCQSWGGGRSGRNSWRYQDKRSGSKHAVRDFSTTAHLFEIADRLKSCFIESDTALNILDRYDNKRSLLYLDPPYLPDLRYSDRGYRFEMTTDEHKTLLERILRLQGNCVISGVPSEMYDDYLCGRGWRRHETEARTTALGLSAETGYSTEVLWISPRCISQPTLFALGDAS